MRGVGQPGPDVALGVGRPHAPPHAGGAGALQQGAGGDLQGVGPRHPVGGGGGGQRGEGEGWGTGVSLLFITTAAPDSMM